MSTLSVVMIVKNEAQCLGACLESVRGIADEIVVGDTGSTDDTARVAERFGAKVLHIPWEDDFAKARNRVLAAATGDWLLHLDADEALDATGAARIRSLVDGDGDGSDAVEATLANYCAEPRAWRWVPVGPDAVMARGFPGYIKTTLLRLFRNGRGFEYREPLHENITESVVECGGGVRQEPSLVIHHYGHSSQGARGKAKAGLYLRILEAKVRQRPEDAKAWQELAEQRLACGDGKGAEEAARTALGMDPLNIDAATTLANLLLSRGDLKGGRRVLEGLESAGVSLPHIGTALAAVACRQGRLDEARTRLEAIVNAAPENVMARLELARVLDRFGEQEAAREQLEKAQAAAPRLAEPGKRLKAQRERMKGRARFEEGEPEAALAALVEALRLDPEDAIAHNDAGVVLASLGENTRARASFRRALQLAPGMAEAEANLEAAGSPT